MMSLERFSSLGLCLWAIGAGSLLAAATEDSLAWLDAYNVEWVGAGKGSSDSMPCGGGDIGLNVWIEKDDLLFYADRSGNIDENDQQLKSGRFRLKLEKGAFGQASIRQKLVLRDGCIELQGTGVRGRIWVEVDRPIIHVDLDTDEVSTLGAHYESWRTQTRSVPLTLGPDGKPSAWDSNRWSMFGYFWYRGEVRSYADAVRFAAPDSVEFVHQNNNEDLIFDKELRQQRLVAAAHELVSPSRDRVFGGRMLGDGMVCDTTATGTYHRTPFSSWSLKSAQPTRHHRLRVFLHTEKTGSLEKWTRNLEALMSQRSTRDAEAWSENQVWWRAFWNRSHVVINPGRGADDLGWRIGRNYQLFRYQLDRRLISQC